jgi:hypothetical protein
LTPSLVRGGSAKTLAVGLVFCTVVFVFFDGRGFLQWPQKQKK